jgi:hypothetical protein
MNNSLERVRPGERLRIPAAAWNRFLDLASMPHDLKADSTGSRQTVLIRNDSGSDREQFEILGLNSSAILPSVNEAEFKNQIIFTGVTPNATAHATKFAVLQEPLPAGKIGRAIISGLAITKLSTPWGEDSGPYASPVTGIYKLRPSLTSGARVLLLIPGGTESWGIISLGDQEQKNDRLTIDAVQMGNFASGQSVVAGELVASANGHWAPLYIDGCQASAFGIKKFLFFPSTSLWKTDNQFGVWEIVEAGSDTTPWRARRWRGCGSSDVYSEMHGELYVLNGTYFGDWRFAFSAFDSDLRFIQPYNYGPADITDGVLDPKNFWEIGFVSGNITAIKCGLCGYWGQQYRRLRLCPSGPTTIFGRPYQSGEVIDLEFVGDWDPSDFFEGKTWGIPGGESFDYGPLSRTTEVGLTPASYLFSGNTLFPRVSLYDGTTVRYGASGPAWDGTVVTGGWVTNIAVGQPAIITNHEARISALEAVIDGGTW